MADVSELDVNAVPDEGAPPAATVPTDDHKQQLVDVDAEVDAQEKANAAAVEAGADDQGKATPEPQAAAEEPAAEVDTDDLVRRATEVGITQEDVDEALQKASIPEDDPRAIGMLEYLIGREERRLLDMGRAELPASAPPAAAAAQTQATQAQAAQAQIEKFALKLKPEEYTPELVQQLQDMNDYWGRKFEQAQQAIARYEQVDQQREAANLQREFHRILDNASEYREVFGRLQDISRNSPQAKNRELLWEEMKALHAGYSKVGRTQTSLDDLANRAMRLTFGDRAKATARKEIASSLERRQKQIVRRPTQRNAADEVDGTAKAIASVTQLMRDNGMLGGDEEAGIPE